MASPLAQRALARGHPQGALEQLLAQLIHRRAIQVSPGIDVEIRSQQLVALRGSDDFDRRHKGEIGNGTITSNKEDSIAAAGHLPSNAFQVVTRTVHKVEPRPFERLAVFNGVVQAHVWIALARRANGLERDIVQTAKFVAPRGIALG